MNTFLKVVLLAFVSVALVGCGNDKVADANKNLKAIDPNAPKPSAATGGSPGGGAAKTGGPNAGADVIK